jgi:hypothetical protein
MEDSVFELFKRRCRLLTAFSGIFSSDPANQKSRCVSSSRVEPQGPLYYVSSRDCRHDVIEGSFKACPSALEISNLRLFQKHYARHPLLGKTFIEEDSQHHSLRVWKWTNGLNLKPDSMGCNAARQSFNLRVLMYLKRGIGLFIPLLMASRLNT